MTKKNKKMPLTKIKVSIIIINWNTQKLLDECLDSIRQFAAGLDHEVIVVDNASSDGSQKMVREKYPEVQLIENTENTGFARANNLAVRKSSAEFVFLLNSDARLTQLALQKMLKLAEKETSAAIVGARLLNPDGSFQASFTPFPNLWREFLILSGLGRLFTAPWYPSRAAELEQGAQIVDYVEGACMLCRREPYLQVGGLDEAYFMYAEEVDLCYTLKEAGHSVWYEPEAAIIHHGGASSFNRRTQREGDLYRSRIRFFEKNYNIFSARLLVLMMGFFILLKSLLHRSLQFFTAGRKGRQVITLKEFRQKLSDPA